MNNTTKIIGALFLTMSFMSTAIFSEPLISKATTKQKQLVLTPKRALELLKEGNQRFVTNQMRDYNFAHEMKITTQKGQHPIAIILSCIDSRSIPDLLFDQGLGNLFVARVAGNVVGNDVLGSMEYSTALAGAPLVVVMGHTHCGAVMGACTMSSAISQKNLDQLLGKIKPAVTHIQQGDKVFSCQHSATLNKITKQNVLNQMQETLANSAALSGMVENRHILIVGAMHDILTGQVTFFDSQGNPI